MRTRSLADGSVALYLAAVLVALAGFAFAAWLALRFFAGMQEPVRFLAPGAGAVEIAAPGSYVIWHEHRTMFEGRTYEAERAMPAGARFRVTGPDGRELAVQPYGNATSDMPGSASVSVGRFDALLPGRHTVAVDGDFSPRVIAVGEDHVWPALRMAGIAAASVLAGIGAAIALVLFALLRGPLRPPPASAEPPRAGSAPPPEEKRARDLTIMIYAMQAASLLLGVTLFVAVIMNYATRREVAGTWLESHYAWQIRTFWWSLLWCVLGFATAIVLIGFLVLLAAAVWFVYRVAHGWINLNARQPMYAGR